MIKNESGFHNLTEYGLRTVFTMEKPLSVSKNLVFMEK